MLVLEDPLDEVLFHEELALHAMLALEIKAVSRVRWRCFASQHLRKAVDVYHSGLGDVMLTRMYPPELKYLP